jgi:hypothetical protein
MLERLQQQTPVRGSLTVAMIFLLGGRTGRASGEYPGPLGNSVFGGEWHCWGQECRDRRTD